MAILASCVSLVQGETDTAAPEFDVILYGATGCVGHFAAAHLANVTFPSGNLSWAIADINATRLDALKASLAAGGGPSSHPAVILATLDGKTDLRGVVNRTKAIVTAAGPFSIHNGDKLVEACAEYGTHYADISDEFFWQRRMVDGYDAMAKSSKAHIVLSAGFCALAGDLGSQLAMALLNSSSKSDVVDVGAYLERYNGGISAGVIATQGADKNATFPKEWTSDPYVLAPNASTSLKLDTSVTGVKYPAEEKGEGLVVSNLFGPYDARLLRRTFTQLGQEVRLKVGSPPTMYTEWSAFIAEHPGSWSSLAKCPDPTVYADGSWRYRFIASTDSGTDTASVVLSGTGDPGYHFTSVGLAETGLCLAGLIPNCTRASATGGVAPPMVTVDPNVMLQRLMSIGLVEITK